jgi:hypothetical protein
MKSTTVYIATALFIASAFLACDKESSVSRIHALAQPSNQSMRQASIAFVQNLWLPAPGKPIAFDGQKFFADHRSEMIETLEIVDTLTVGDIGVALVRYSLSTDIYRSAIWMRNIERSWWPMGSQYFSKYSNGYEVLEDEAKEQADVMIEKAKIWEEESKKAWWIW